MSPATLKCIINKYQRELGGRAGAAATTSPLPSDAVQCPLPNKQSQKGIKFDVHNNQTDFQLVQLVSAENEEDLDCKGLSVKAQSIKHSSHKKLTLHLQLSIS